MLGILRTSAVTITSVLAGLPPRQLFDGKNSGSCGQVVAIWIAVLSFPTARYCTESTDTTELVHWQFDRHYDFSASDITKCAILASAIDIILIIHLT